MRCMRKMQNLGTASRAPWTGRHEERRNPASRRAVSKESERSWHGLNPEVGNRQRPFVVCCCVLCAFEGRAA